MFQLTAPSEDQIRRFISAQHELPFSYPKVGASAGNPPTEYNVNHNRIELGYGLIAWQRAIEAIRGWQMFNIPWLRLCWETAPIRVGTEVAVLVRHFGFYSLNACRIVYRIDNGARTKRFGFGYGTLEEHPERGEEPFTVGGIKPAPRSTTTSLLFPDLGRCWRDSDARYRGADFLSAIEFLITREDFTGCVNLSSPNPVPNREFMRALRQARGTRIGLPAAKWMLEIGSIFLRTETELVLKSRRVVPGRLLEAGFQFKFPDWSVAAQDLVARLRASKS